MRVGSVCFPTIQGLGLLVADFYHNGVLQEVYPIAHPFNPNYDWYGPIASRPGTVDWPSFDKFLDRIDVLFLFETFFNDKIISKAKNKNIKIVLMPMYECTGSWPNKPRYKPDLIINPSLLDQKHYPTGEFLPVPIPKWVDWKERKQAKVFVHNAGNWGLKGRNGTKEIIRALPIVKSPIKLILRSQRSVDSLKHLTGLSDPRLEIRVGTVSSKELFEEGDVFLFPEKFNGLSLPLQEAHASGMTVMCGNRFPMNTWLPTDPLIDVSGYENCKPLTNFAVESAVITPEAIANKIDEIYGKDVSEYSREGYDFKESCSWDNLRDKYLEKLHSTLHPV